MQMILRLHRLSSTLRRNKLGVVGRCVDGAIRLIYSAYIPGEAVIAEDVFFHHSGLGVVINKASVIKASCEIGVHVVLGGRAPLSGAPLLEERVIVHAGAKIIGPLRIGAGSIIAANAVVLADVPPACLVAGVPAVIKKRDIQADEYRHDSPMDSG